MSEQKSQDLHYMQRVMDLAEQGAMSTDPNPMVGCVIVKNGKIVGEGYHLAAGGLHAEREALAQAGEKSRGATAYVNLEPCCHQGRTPPCTDALVDAGIVRVVAAMLDPNPLVEGGGFSLLSGAGIEVEHGLLETEAKWLNRGFVNRMSLKKPWVTLKTAATLDGKTASYDGASKWITGEEARNHVQELRARSSAIITGIGTVLADDPSMNVRIGNHPRQPFRVLLDSQLRLPLDAKIIGTDQKLVVFTLSNDEAKIAALTEIGVEVIHQDSSNNTLDLTQVLSELVNWECNTVMVEAGQTLSGSFLRENLVDEMNLFYAGSLLGDQAMDMFKFTTPVDFDKRYHHQVKDVSMIGDDVKIHTVKTNNVELLG